MIGAVKTLVEGGLRQMSVGKGADRVSLWGGWEDGIGKWEEDEEGLLRVWNSMETSTKKGLMVLMSRVGWILLIGMDFGLHANRSRHTTQIHVCPEHLYGHQFSRQFQNHPVKVPRVSSHFQTLSSRGQQPSGHHGRVVPAAAEASTPKGDIPMGDMQFCCTSTFPVDLELNGVGQANFICGREYQSSSNSSSNSFCCFTSTFAGTYSYLGQVKIIGETGQ